MLRQQLNDALKQAMLGKDAPTVSTVRLILAALKDRDIAARPKGLANGIPDDEILSMLQGMVKQRKESIALYQQGNRQDLVDKEAGEINIIEKFLPAKMSEAETQAAITETIKAIGAQGLKDMGRTMAALKEKFPGRMDFTKASAMVKQQLG
jgi:uncharacterized protein YqeY